MTLAQVELTLGLQESTPELLEANNDYFSDHWKPSKYSTIAIIHTEWSDFIVNYIYVLNMFKSVYPKGLKIKRKKRTTKPNLFKVP